MTCNTTEKVDQKVEALKKYIYFATLSSAAVGATPVPGVSLAADLGIIAANAFHQMKALSLDGHSIEIRTMGHNGKRWSKDELLREVGKALGEEDKLMAAWLPALGVKTVGEILDLLPKLILFIPALLACSVSEATLKLIPIVGSVIGFGTSGATTYWSLKEILGANIKIAKSIIIVLDPQKLLEVHLQDTNNKFVTFLFDRMPPKHTPAKDWRCLLLDADDCDTKWEDALLSLAVTYHPGSLGDTGHTDQCLQLCGQITQELIKRHNKYSVEQIFGDIDLY